MGFTERLAATSHIALEALRNLPRNLTTNAVPNGKPFDLVPTREDISKFNGTVVNGGTAENGEGWGQTLQRELANRYTAAAFCSWWATGGLIPNVLPRKSNQDLHLTGSLNNTGNMFENFSNLDIDPAGSGGEYTVQAGFGWTNGVALWVASPHGDILDTSKCPNITANAVSNESNSGGNTSGGASGAASVTVSVVLAMVVSGVMLWRG
ncbi:hypothetical protein BJ322DRAFT_1161667 [Thelephora terrestris]|uniref:alpha,alpha-trehalase n=1 Tax=Thelephora terrestris TaxID=56493 RepID=A0A9P6HA42_9AGAM|nr:hypothetical protein BJ322DRAFT_1161667 [Thelephora terrestris]